MELLDFYQRIKQYTNIVNVISRFVKVKMKGREALGLCPFHKEKTPSFTISVEKNFYHCFGCSAHGDVIEFYSKYFSIKYHNAAIKIAQEYKIELPPKLISSYNRYYTKNTVKDNFEPSKMVKFFQLQLNDSANSYLIKRGINKETVANFEIGFLPNKKIFQNFITKNNIKNYDLIKIGLISSNNNPIFTGRIIFPIKNYKNTVIGFGGRTIEHESKFAKYLNSPETGIFKKKETLYGENIALQESSKTGFFILVEGYLDVIILHQLGFKSTGAVLGTSFSKKHLEKIFLYSDELIICFDNDFAGNKATERLINIILPFITPQKKVSFITLPRNSDPGDLVNFKNKEIFHYLLKTRLSLSEKIWYIEYNRKKISTAEDKAFVEFKLYQYSNIIRNKITKNNFEFFFRSQLWHLLKSTKSHYQSSIVINKNALASKISKIKNYTEIELLESIIISLVFFYPQILSSSYLLDQFQEIEFKKDEYKDLQFFICEAFLQKNDLDFQKLYDSIENTRFKALGMILLELASKDCAVLFSQMSLANSKNFFNFFIKKRYLFLLCKEYSKIIQDHAEDFLSAKIPLYVEEIHKLNSEINTLNEEVL